MKEIIAEIKGKISEKNDIFDKNNWEKSYVFLTKDIRCKAFIGLSEERKSKPKNHM